MKTTFATLAALAISLAAPAASAQSLVDGDADAGKAKSITCAACHGAAGNSANPLWPNLAGQHAKYIVNQLGAFKEGKRVNALMSSQAMLLSEDDMANLAVYYEGLEPATQTVADPDLVDKGEALYRAGNAETGVAACIACHGPKGVGNAAAQYPSLSGQHAAYTEKTLKDYRSGERKSIAGNNAMNEIAAKLTDDEIKALASYVQGLH
ncbi:MAG: c-type cytochrome [Woeseiaceae bacterium]|jgi:cytochrome c553|nr:c-type cytochrome [Woeseiaceae bacterium]